MTDDLKIWHGGVSVGASRTCDECGAPADTLFEIGRTELHSKDPGRWACGACVLDPARQIGVIDRRGDTLHGQRIARELDIATAIALHLEVKDRAEHPGIDYGTMPELPPLPRSYLHVLLVLHKLIASHDQFADSITDFRNHYQRAAFFSPKQMSLAQWRLVKCYVTHDPKCFVVSTRTEKEIAALREMDDFKKQKITPYLSLQQRARFGLF